MLFAQNQFVYYSRSETSYQSHRVVAQIKVNCPLNTGLQPACHRRHLSFHPESIKPARAVWTVAPKLPPWLKFRWWSRWRNVSSLATRVSKQEKNEKNM